MDITVCIVERTMIRPSERESMVRRLNEYFEAVANRPHGGAFNVTTLCVGRNRCPTLGRRDVIVYAVSDADHSAFPQADGDSPPTGHGGFTRLDLPAPGATGRGRHCASEVYVRSAFGTLLATLAFHETLHYKTGWSNRRLHNHHGGGVSQARLNTGVQINDADLDLMAQYLNRTRTPWMAGCAGNAQP